MRILAPLIAIGSCFPQSAAAMTFRVGEDGRANWVLGIGVIEQGDDERLLRILETRQVDTLVLASPGGSVDASMVLGHVVRDRRLNTVVPTGAECLSACFFAYVAGNHRWVAEGATLGVHQFSGGTWNETAENVQQAAQVVVAELIQFSFEMGIGIEALHVALRTPPEEIHIFSRIELERYGLLGKASTIVYGETYEKDCPFPKEYKLADPMNLYPECH